VFRSAINYVDADLTTSEEVDVKTYKLAGLYDRYFEYPDLFTRSCQGGSCIPQIPTDYKGSHGATADFSIDRERLLAADGTSDPPINERSRLLLQRQYTCCSCYEGRSSGSSQCSSSYRKLFLRPICDTGSTLGSCLTLQLRVNRPFINLSMLQHRLNRATHMRRFPLHSRNIN
jgi:hypothetical protein